MSEFLVSKLTYAIKRELNRSVRTASEREDIRRFGAEIAKAAETEQLTFDEAAQAFCDCMNRFAKPGKHFCPKTLSFRPTKAAKQQAAEAKRVQAQITAAATLAEARAERLQEWYALQERIKRRRVAAQQ